MPAEHGPARGGGLRREHLVAAALVTATTIVLGFASGLGVIDAGAGGSIRSAPDRAATAPPGVPQAGPAAAGAVPAVTVPPGRQVGVLPGSHHIAEPAPAAGSAADVAGGVAPGFGFAETPGFGHLPVHDLPPLPGAVPGAAPDRPAPPAPPCPLGILDPLLSLLAQVLGGARPAPAPVDSAAPPLTALPLTAPAASAAATEPVTTEQAAGQGTGQIAGQTAAQAETGAPGLLAPAMTPDPADGSSAPLPVPVLGSLGCGALVPAAPPGAGW